MFVRCVTSLGLARTVVVNNVSDPTSVDRYLSANSRERRTCVKSERFDKVLVPRKLESKAHQPLRFPIPMAPQSRGPLLTSHDLFSPSPTDESAILSPDDQTPTRPTYINHLGHPQSPSYDPNSGFEDDDELDFQTQYSFSGNASSGSSSEDSVLRTDGLNGSRPYLHQSNSSLLIANAFAPPFYNKPPTPLPPSPSLTSLLRPSFSTTTSRPTTPDSSDNDTPNDTEAAVAKSARTATTVPRASPKVPTYEYYGFVLYLASSLAFRMPPASSPLMIVT